MEISPQAVTVILTIVGFFISLIVAGIPVVVWLSRVDSNAKQNTRDIEEAKVVMDKHVADKFIHHDGKWLDDKFTDLKSSMDKMDETMKDILGRALDLLSGHHQPEDK